MPLKDIKKRKLYQKEYGKKHYLKNKKYYKNKVSSRKKNLHMWFQNYKKNLSCKMCGENFLACLDFHHLNESEKDFNVAYMALSGYSKERIKKEIDKCIVLCSNCHRKLHYFMSLKA